MQVLDITRVVNSAKNIPTARTYNHLIRTIYNMCWWSLVTSALVLINTYLTEWLIIIGTDNPSEWAWTSIFCSIICLCRINLGKLSVQISKRIERKEPEYEVYYICLACLLRWTKEIVYLFVRQRTNHQTN